MPTLTIGQTAIPYEIRRSPKVRRQRIVVTPQGMEVVAPVGADNQDIEVFVHRRRRWIYEQREKMREQLASSPWPEHFVSGAKIPYRGRRMRLKVRTVSGDSIITYYHNGFIV
ncbi:MAG: M48 family metallopeptidase, partial [Phycisphaerales bacterium]|nr:M48 family metallopeptidase [Phycisphaerales bacterium]